MSEPEDTTPNEDATNETEAPPNVEAQGHTTPTPPADHQGNKYAKEAAKYRVQLRDAEARLGQVEARLAAAQQQIANEALKSVLPKPEAFWKVGNQPGTYFTEDGALDTDRLNSDANKVANDLGITLDAYEFERYGGLGARSNTKEPAKSWQTLIRVD